MFPSQGVPSTQQLLLATSESKNDWKISVLWFKPVIMSSTEKKEVLVYFMEFECVLAVFGPNSAKNGPKCFKFFTGFSMVTWEWLIVTKF